MARFEYLVEVRSPVGRRQRPGLVSHLAAGVVESEWTSAPLGGLGRRLWTDIDRYLEFVAIARSEPLAAASDRGRHAPGRDPSRA